MMPFMLGEDNRFLTAMLTLARARPKHWHTPRSGGILVSCVWPSLDIMALSQPPIQPQFGARLGTLGCLLPARNPQNAMYLKMHLPRMQNVRHQPIQILLPCQVQRTMRLQRPKRIQSAGRLRAPSRGRHTQRLASTASTPVLPAASRCQGLTAQRQRLRAIMR
jgi:hypothetical protein